MKQKEVYGTKRAPAYRLFIDCMNLKATTIYDTVQDEDGKERRVLNQAETIAAREKRIQLFNHFPRQILLACFKARISIVYINFFGVTEYRVAKLELDRQGNL